MKSKGNSRPELCVNNLLRMSRGEASYDRVRGVSYAQIDKGSSEAADEVVADAEWMLKTYEPRVAANSIAMLPTDAENGAFELRADITIKEGYADG